MVYLRLANGIIKFNVDYKISYSYLDRIINKVVAAQGNKKVFGVSSTNKSIGSFIYLIVEGKNVTKRKLEQTLKLKEISLGTSIKLNLEKNFTICAGIWVKIILIIT